jgi:hypothetical protein
LPFYLISKIETKNEEIIFLKDQLIGEQNIVISEFSNNLSDITNELNSTQ